MSGPAPQPAPQPAPTPRLWVLDAAKGVALLGMAAFHLLYDLILFGRLAPSDLPPGWLYWHPRLVAGSFILLAGLSLWLAHGAGLRGAAFGRRLAKIAAAAGLVSVATYLALPSAWVFFGILHAIAAFSLLALPLLRAPLWLVAALAVGVAGLSWVDAPALFNAPALAFLGLADVPPRTVDFEPVVPWFAVFLAGMIAGRVGTRAGLWRALGRLPAPGAGLGLLARGGRHSLVIYLVHQPVLLALVAAYDRLMP